MANKLDKTAQAEKLLFATNFMKVLGLFLKNPSAKLYGGEVARQTRLSKAGANFALRDLARAGFLTRESKGRLHFYALERGNPLVRQLKVVRSVLALVSLIEDLKKDSEKIVLYGSVATGEDTEESDVDILILTREKGVVQKKITRMMKTEKIQPVIHTPHEWTVLESKNRVFTEQVARGIVLWESNET
jgi:predicted nucleotidyltransferase